MQRVLSALASCVVHRPTRNISNKRHLRVSATNSDLLNTCDRKDFLSTKEGKFIVDKIDIVGSALKLMLRCKSLIQYP